MVNSSNQERRHNKKRARKRDRKAEYKRLIERRHEHIAELNERWKTQPPGPEDEIAACLYVGGSKPIDPSTLWHRYSRPIKVGAQAVRWPRSNLDADMARMNAVEAAEPNSPQEDTT
jgi:hypothetical protein